MEKNYSIRLSLDQYNEITDLAKKTLGENATIKDYFLLLHEKNAGAINTIIYNKDEIIKFIQDLGMLFEELVVSQKEMLGTDEELPFDKKSIKILEYLFTRTLTNETILTELFQVSKGYDNA